MSEIKTLTNSNDWNHIIVFAMFLYSLLSLSLVLSVIGAPNLIIRQVSAKKSDLQNLEDLNLQHIGQNMKAFNNNLILPIIPLHSNNEEHSSITKETRNGLYNIKLIWDPLEIKEGGNTIDVLDPKTNLEAKHVDYSFKATYSSTNVTIKDVKNQKVPTGTGIQIINFPRPGPITISINVIAQQIQRISSNNNISSNTSDNVNFSLMVSPKELLVHPSIKNTRIIQLQQQGPQVVLNSKVLSSQ